MRPMKKGSSGLKIKPDNKKKQGNPPSRNINNMNGSVVSAQNPTKKYLIHSLSEVGKEQRAADEKRFSLIHDKKVAERRKKWIQELEQKVIDTRAELRARTGTAGIGASKFVMKKIAKPTGLVGKVKVNTNFKIDPSGPFASNEAAEKLWEFVKNEKVKLYHTVPRTRNHSIRHTLEEAEAPARRITVVSPKDRAEVMKRNALKSIETRTKLDLMSSMEYNSDEDETIHQSMMVDTKTENDSNINNTGSIAIDLNITTINNNKKNDNNNNQSDNTMKKDAGTTIPTKANVVITQDTNRDMDVQMRKVNVEMEKEKRKMDMEMSTSEFKAIYGYKPTFSNLKKPKSNIRNMADSVLYDALPHTNVDNNSKHERNSDNDDWLSSSNAMNNNNNNTKRNDTKKTVTFASTSSLNIDLMMDDTMINDDNNNSYVGIGINKNPSPNKKLKLNNNKVDDVQSIILDEDADDMMHIYSSPLSSSYITRKTPTPPRTRPLSPPSNVKLANVMSDALNEDLQYEIETFKTNIGQAFDSVATKNNVEEDGEDEDNINNVKEESTLVEIEEAKDDVLIGDAAEEEDEIDPMNASNISNEDPMNSSNISLGTAALENAMASIIATNDAAYGISPLPVVRRGVSSTQKEALLDVTTTAEMDSLYLGTKQPLNNNNNENDKNNNSIVTVELNSIIDEDSNNNNDDRSTTNTSRSPFKVNDGDTSFTTGTTVPLETLEDEIWKEHLALQKLGLV